MPVNKKNLNLKDYDSTEGKSVSDNKYFLPKMKTMYYTQELAYKAIEGYVLDSLNDMAAHYIRGEENTSCFDSFFFLKNKFDMIVDFFHDCCAEEIFAASDCEAIVIVSSEGPRTCSVIYREDFSKNKA